MSLINILVIIFCLTPLLAWSMVTLYFEYMERNDDDDDEQTNL